MQPSLWKTVVFFGGLLIQLVAAQQYAGDFINNSLPYVPGAEINYFKIKEPTGKVPKAYNLTLINYQSLQANGQRLVPSQIQRAVVIIHGLNRDPGTYISNIQSALAQVTDPNINKSSVLMMAPYFPNGADKNYGYPYNETNPAAPGKVYSGSARSYTGALVWSGSAWSGGGANQYPAAYQTVSSYYVLDQLIQWFGNTANFPNMKEIIIAGHSLGGQTVQRYAVAGPLPTALGVTIPVTHWIANPNSYVWLNSSRPLSTASCAGYDQWRDGLTNFTGYTSPAVYQQSLMTSSVTAIQNNYYAKNKAYARGLADTGDDSSGCAPELSGANRNERFFAFLKWFPNAVQCQAPNSTTGHCDTVDEVNIGHDAGAMMSCPAGQARLFTDNFYGNGSRAYDFGYPRVQAGDDPFPNPDLASTSTANQTVYAGNMTLQGCYSDNTGERTLTYSAYDSPSNTIEMCTQTCVNAGYTVAGVEYGSQCYCGNALGGEAVLVVSVGCNTVCAGNSNETCGANGRINIYSNGQPAQLAAPGQPDAVLDSPANVYYNFLDCYSEATSGRALSAKSYTDTKNMTLENCAAFCSGYQYFGVEYSQECYCGSCFNAGAGIIDDSKCSMTCTGDATEFCGAGNALSVYQLDSDSGLAVISQSCAAGSTTTTTSAAPTSTIPAASLCPNVDGQNILDSNNNNYTVHCSSDNSVGSYSSSSATNSYLDCMTACDAQSSCLGFTYVGVAYGAGAGTCYLKSSAGTYTSAGTNLISAFKASSSSSSASGTATTSAAATSSSSAANLCPAADGTTITDSNGNNYTVHCASDNSVGSYASTSATNTYLDCMTACDAQSSCLGFTYVGATYGAGSGTCYLKSSMGTYTSAGANLISVAKVSSGSSSSSSSVSGTTSTSTTSAAATSSSSAANLCPAADGTTIADSNGNNYTVHCSSDSSVGSYASASASNSYLDCMTACDTQSSTGCLGFTYVGAAYGAGSGTCYLKTSAGTFTSAGTNLISAFKASSGVSSSSSSVSGTTTTSTTSAAASSSSSAANLCPAANGQIITDSKGNNYTVHCASDNSFGSYTSASASNSYLDCMTACDAQSSTGCTGFTYVGANYGAGSGTCYLKTSMSTYTSAGANLISAAKVSGGSSSSSSSSSSASSTTTTSGSSTSSSAAATSSAVSCPGSDQSTYTASNGAQFLIECGIDHQGGDLTSVGGVDFAGCINACATTAGCVDVSLSGNACYEKSVLGAAVSNAGIWGAKLITSTSSSSSSSVATTSSTSSSVASTTSSTVSTSSTSSTSSPAVTSSSSSTSTVASSTTSAFPSATATTCPGMDQSSMVDANGATYNIYCSADTGNQVLAVIQTSAGILGCMADCDQTTGCTAFTFSGDSTMTNGYCYLRTIGSRSSGGSTLAVGQLVSSGTTTNQNNAISSGTSSSSTSSSTSSPAPTSTSSSSTVSTTSSSTSSSSTTSITPAAPTVVGNYTSLGCYNDTVSARALQGGYTSNSKMTIEMCGTYCSGYTYWGVEYGQECYCGNTLLNGSQNKTLSSCSFTCPGNSTELCGAGNRLQMYSLTPSSSTSSSSASSTSSASITSSSSTSTASITSSATTSTGTTSSSSSSTTTSTGAPQRRRRGLAGMRV